MLFSATTEPASSSSPRDIAQGLKKYSVEAKSSIQAVIEKSHGLADTPVFPIHGPIGVVYYAMFGAGGKSNS